MAKDAKLILNVDAKLSPGEFRTWIILAPFVALVATALSGDDIIVTLLVID